MAPYLLRSGRSLLVCLVLVCLLALVAVLARRPAQAEDRGNPPTQGSDTQLHALLTERYETLKGAVAWLDKLAQSGRADFADLRDCTVALYQAQADLCPSVDARVKVWEKLVDVLRTYERSTQQRADAGQGSALEVAKTKLARLDAQITLARLRQAPNP